MTRKPPSQPACSPIHLSVAPREAPRSRSLHGLAQKLDPIFLLYVATCPIVITGATFADSWPMRSSERVSSMLSFRFGMTRSAMKRSYGDKLENAEKAQVFLKLVIEAFTLENHLQDLSLVSRDTIAVATYAIDDCRIGQFDVPHGSILMVNMWAIRRDPKFWDDPTSFKPERFKGGEVEAHVLMPFGKGRRACPGARLA
ncbi:unnamed protein product [Thlaspi arvense]|uniref:Cytochrome P450 n=1 Tax=Thlaspi arvense TaxID=13288 RepID=A0AAU9TC04_THLAR|nr:unnamed protein product [Thlaspi arvense]